MLKSGTDLPPLSTLLRRWGQTGCLNFVEAGWQESLATQPARSPDFLKPEQIEESRIFAGLSGEYQLILQEAALRITADPALVAFAWHTYRRAYIETDTTAFGKWPEFDQPLGQEGRLFYVILALASVPLMRRRHRALGIPRQIARDTANDLVIACHRSVITRPDFPGLAPGELDWFQHHADASVFRIGRLEYRYGPFLGEIRIYRNLDSGETAALAQPGTFFDSCGFQVSKSDNSLPTPGIWKSSLEETKGRIFGNLVSPKGYVLREPRVLPKSEWKLLVAPGDPILDVHIPAGGGLTLDRCRLSMQEAVAFYARYFPADPLPKIFSCMTWFLGPQLREILPPMSNILRFQRAVHLFPIQTNGNEGFYFIFGRNELPESLSENASSLQTSIHRYVREGKPWRGGGMFFPTNEVDRFGDP